MNKKVLTTNPLPSTLYPLPSKFFELVPKTNIDFIRLRYFFYGLSALLIAGTIGLFVTRGPSLGIDFTGGVVVEFKLPPHQSQNQIGGGAPLRSALSPSIEQVREVLRQQNLEGSVQTLGRAGEFMARFKKEEEEKGLDNRVHQALSSLAPDVPYQILRKEFVGAVVGERLRSQALMAIGLSFLGIIIYVGFRFRNLIWGVSGVVALIHDVIAAAGFITLMGYEIDLVMVAAFLTIAGYSINDTVVIFDRLRERFHLYPKEQLSEAINRAVNDTMSRTIITAGTVFLAVLMLVIFGGSNLRSFAVALLFGTIVGAYSTVGVASNLVHGWQKLTGFKVR